MTCGAISLSANSRTIFLTASCSSVRANETPGAAASSLVKIDLDGKKVMDSPHEINPAGFTIHSAVHAAREDALCVMHTHSLNGVAVSAQKAGLLPISQQS